MSLNLEWYPDFAQRKRLAVIRLRAATSSLEAAEATEIAEEELNTETPRTRRRTEIRIETLSRQASRASRGGK
jgi:hypothetical protein